MVSHCEMNMSGSGSGSKVCDVSVGQMCIFINAQYSRDVVVTCIWTEHMCYAVRVYKRCLLYGLKHDKNGLFENYTFLVYTVNNIGMVNVRCCVV